VTRRTALAHQFVEYIPDDVDDGTIYVSIPFATAVHKCCCGCGEEVVTPLSPTDWQLTFDGESISLAPSVGNWGFDCGSHYWIHRGRVKWARRWSKEEIEAGRDSDRMMKVRRFGANRACVTDQASKSDRAPGGASWLARLWGRLRKRTQ